MLRQLPRVAVQTHSSLSSKASLRTWQLCRFSTTTVPNNTPLKESTSPLALNNIQAQGQQTHAHVNTSVTRYSTEALTTNYREKIRASAAQFMAEVLTLEPTPIWKDPATKTGLLGYKVSLPEGVFWPIPGSRRDLYIRVCGEKMLEEFERVWPTCMWNTCVISGNYGSGKSWWLMYCLYKYLKEGKVVRYVYEDSKFQIVFDPRNGTVDLCDVKEQALAGEVILHDAQDGNSNHKLEDTIEGVRKIIVSKGYYSTLRKSAIPMCMPVFTLEEAQAFNSFILQKGQQYEADQLVTSYNAVGGCLRKLFALDLKQQCAEIQRNLQQLDMKEEKYTELEHDVISGYHSRGLFQVVSEPPHFEYKGVTWASKDICRDASLLFERGALQLDPAVMFELLRRHPDSENAVRVTASYQEQVIDVLRNGGQFCLYDVDPTFYAGAMKTIELPNCREPFKSSGTIDGLGVDVLQTLKPDIWISLAANRAVDAMYRYKDSYVAIQTSLSGKVDFQWKVFRKYLNESKQTKLQFWIVTNSEPSKYSTLVTMSEPSAEATTATKDGAATTKTPNESTRDIMAHVEFKVLVIPAKLPAQKLG